MPHEYLLVKTCGESDFYRNVFTFLAFQVLAFTNQTHLMQLTAFGNITVMRFSFLPYSLWHSACSYFHRGVWGRVCRGLKCLFSSVSMISRLPPNYSVLRMPQTDVRSHSGLNCMQCHETHQGWILPTC